MVLFSSVLAEQLLQIDISSPELASFPVDFCNIIFFIRFLVDDCRSVVFGLQKVAMATH